MKVAMNSSTNRGIPGNSREFPGIPGHSREFPGSAGGIHAEPASRARSPVFRGQGLTGRAEDPLCCGQRFEKILLESGRCWRLDAMEYHECHVVEASPNINVGERLVLDHFGNEFHI